VNEIRLRIAGQPPRKRNSRRIVYRYGKNGRRNPMVIKSRKALSWVEAAQ
jgi:hypothetical protein